MVCLQKCGAVLKKLSAFRNAPNRVHSFGRMNPLSCRLCQLSCVYWVYLLVFLLAVGVVLSSCLSLDGRPICPVPSHTSELLTKPVEAPCRNKIRAEFCSGGGTPSVQQDSDFPKVVKMLLMADSLVVCNTRMRQKLPRPGIDPGLLRDRQKY